RSLTVRLSAVDSNIPQSGRKRTPKVAPTGLVLRRVGPRKSPIQVPQTRSTFHRHAQRNAFHHHDVRQQSRLFSPSESIADTQPQLQPALLRLSAIVSQLLQSVGCSIDC